MKKREAALRAGHVEHYKRGRLRISLYWELYLPDKSNVPIGAFTVDIGSGVAFEGGRASRHRFDNLEPADQCVFMLRDKTPADLALQVFGVTLTPDDDEEE